MLPVVPHHGFTLNPLLSHAAASADARAQKKVYKCQRCQNHGKVTERRDHKLECPFRECTCELCQMVSERSNINSRIKDIDESIIRPESSATSDVPDDPESERKKGERNPCCQRCRAHGEFKKLKNHKKSCLHKDCVCPKCSLVEDRRVLMRKQIKLRRKQQRMREEEKNRKQKEREEHQRQTLADYHHFSFPVVPVACPYPVPVMQCSHLYPCHRGLLSAFSPPELQLPSVGCRQPHPSIPFAFTPFAFTSVSFDALQAAGSRLGPSSSTASTSAQPKPPSSTQ